MIDCVYLGQTAVQRQERSPGVGGLVVDGRLVGIPNNASGVHRFPSAKGSRIGACILSAAKALGRRALFSTPR